MVALQVVPGQLALVVVRERLVVQLQEQVLLLLVQVLFQQPEPLCFPQLPALFQLPHLLQGKPARYLRYIWHLKE